MKMKRTAAGAIAALLLTGGLVAVSAPALADDVCVPSEETSRTERTDWLLEAPEGEGWTLVETKTVTDAPAVPPVERVSHIEYLWMFETEHYEHLWHRYVVTQEAQDEQGTPTIMVPNPDHVPEQVIEHEAIYKTVHHEAVYGTEWKYVLHGHNAEKWLDNNTFKYWVPLVGGTDTKPEWGAFFERTSKTRQGDLITPAYDEQVLVKEAWTEIIPAVGDPQIEVPNPDYKPAVPEQGEWEYRWSETSPGEEWIKTSKSRQIDSTWEYQWNAEQPGDGWIKSSRSKEVVDQEYIPGTPAVTHEEHRYEITVVTPAVECPDPEPTAEPTPEPTEEPTIDPTPEPEPTQEPTQEPTTEPVARPAAQQAPVVTPDVPVQQGLAETGTSDTTATLIVVAALLLLGGVVLMVVRRIKR
jgi:LPXTG-motif cell wall-anchored protein